MTQILSGLLVTENKYVVTYPADDGYRLRGVEIV